MPELPEIETIRRDLQELVIGAQVVRVKTNDPIVIPLSTARRLKRNLRGQTIESLGRCGKVLVINLSGGWSVLQRFGMTGQMFPLLAGEPLPSHSRMVWELDDGRRLVYRDARRFGETRLVKTKQVPEALRDHCHLGGDALEEEITAEELAELLAPHRVALKNFLMDQTHLAGIGNIYASEILHRCRLHPEMPANSLTQRQIRGLLRTIRRVLQEAVAAQGTTISDYRTGENTSGGYQKFLRVYGREGKRCRRRGCSGTIVCTTQAGRSTFYCPQCQSMNESKRASR